MVKIVGIKFGGNWDNIYFCGGFQIIDILILMKVRVFTAFSGYDSQCLALEGLKRDFPMFDYGLVG